MLSPDALRALRVLIIDDDDFTLDIAEMLLQQIGITQIERAQDGSVGLVKLDAATTPFDVVLCDLQMDGMDGIEVLRHLGDAERAPALIFLSGADERMLSSVSALGRKYGLNVLAALRKPLSVTTLAEALHRYEPAAVRSGERVSRQANAELLTPEQIRHGLIDDAVTVHLHPKVGLSNNEPVGLECLLRWRDPVRGIVPPSAVLSVAEAHGLIHEITLQVFQLAVTTLAELLRESHDVTISVNLSISDLSILELPEQLVRIAQAAGVPTGRITLEIAEHPALLAASVEQDVITRLALRGFAVSLDDFGTGYASLQSLGNLPVKELKVHRAFVTGATQRPVSLAILQSSVELGHQLGLRVIAKGVETDEDVALVRTLNCDAMQGDAIARPMSPEMLRPWLNARTVTLPERRSSGPVVPITGRALAPDFSHQ
jgi:EAL domain-containing protein (putative c-di-GMP-specific phosphodiesterase class I)/CheY-like chemotaxis protein